MFFFARQDFYRLIVFIWLISILTLSISDEIETDGNTSLTSALNTSFIGGSLKTEHQILSSVILSTSEPVNSTETLNKNVATPSVAGEGGPISIISSTQQASSTASHLTNIQNNVDEQAKLSKEETNNPYANGKNYTSKIVSRKGANEMLQLKNESASAIEITPSYGTKSLVDSTNIASIVRNNEQVDKNANISKPNNIQRRINNDSKATVNNTLHSILQQKLPTSVSATVSTIQEHKPKPTATVIEPNSDKHAYVPYIKGPHLGIPKKIDYVLPVIVTLIALPVLGAIMFMVYKQGRDYWEKRHYRRMDFLIDGMYND